MTIQTLARRTQSEAGRSEADAWDMEMLGASWEKIAFVGTRKRLLAKYEEALKTPPAKVAAALREAALAKDGKQIGEVAARWASDSPGDIRYIPEADKARFRFHVAVVRDLRPERQKRLARRVGDVLEFLGADALKGMPPDDIRAALTERGLPIRRIRDVAMAVRIYRAGIAATEAERPVRQLTMVNLFDGVGAATLAASGLDGRIKVVAVSEVNRYAIEVTSRHNPEIPHLGDVQAIDWPHVVSHYGSIDIISAGFPCQNISAAGDGEGLQGEKSMLFREAVRAMREVQPKYAIIENVEALFNDGERRYDLCQIVREIAKAGYRLDIAHLDATDFGLPMLRPRFYAVAVRKDLAKLLPRRRAWHRHDIVGPRPEVWHELREDGSIDPKDHRLFKHYVRRLGLNLDTCTDITKALDAVRRTDWPEPVPPPEGAPPGAGPTFLPPWERRRPLPKFLGGLVSRFHVPQPAWLGDILDRKPEARLMLPASARRLCVAKWIKEDRKKAKAKRDPRMARMDRHHYDSRNPDLTPRDLTGELVVMASGLSHTLHQHGTYGLGGLGVRPHSHFTATTKPGLAVDQEGMIRLLSLDEQDAMMGFPRGYTYAEVDGQPPTDSDRQAAIGNSMALPCIRHALEGVLIAELCLRGM
ncbi:DNA cytosine methyltransferase [Magnetospirillum aberrantis]|uniref:Cytosine-specific methyltransferase n=1 Tax=Magnetospirillum aberrantis SpK TaxID=908842 RepID=A0A7C9US34_9PROT|nr:DNA (cytosine-5-)-methyltransferase [Magnetospirillum aberrantis]NFV79007.1 DNA (cytosine-5-)-methyltransferase [Magnetospirillum aberrantis SpK]